MLQTTFYDSTRFKGQAEATMRGELYRVRYAGELMIITFPCGKEKEVKLQMPMNDRVSKIDEPFMLEYIGGDMKKREEWWKKEQKKPKPPTVGAGEKLDPTFKLKKVTK